MSEFQRLNAGNAEKGAGRAQNDEVSTTLQDRPIMGCRVRRKMRKNGRIILEVHRDVIDRFMMRKG